MVAGGELVRLVHVHGRGRSLAGEKLLTCARGAAVKKKQGRKGSLDARGVVRQGPLGRGSTHGACKGSVEGEKNVQGAALGFAK